MGHMTTEQKEKLKEVISLWRREQEPPIWKSETAVEAIAGPL